MNNQENKNTIAKSRNIKLVEIERDLKVGMAVDYFSVLNDCYEHGIVTEIHPDFKHYQYRINNSEWISLENVLMIHKLHPKRKLEYDQNEEA